MGQSTECESVLLFKTESPPFENAGEHSSDLNGGDPVLLQVVSFQLGLEESNGYPLCWDFLHSRWISFIHWFIQIWSYCVVTE